MKRRLFTLLLSTLLLGIQVAFGVTVQFKGEVNDDGGDPYLEVWFEYGKTTAYGYKTSRQSKYGTGEFVSEPLSLEACTTYHYRAVAKHRDYEDTTYGQDMTYTTECRVSVDLQGPSSVSYQNRTITLSWNSQNADYCIAETQSKPTQSNVNWSGQKPTNSTGEQVTLDRAGTYIFRLTCTNSATGNSAIDTLTVTLQAPGLVVITKGVVVTY